MTRSPSGRSGQATVLGGVKVRHGSSNSNCDFSEEVLITRTVCKKLVTGAKEIMRCVLFFWCVGCDDALHTGESVILSGQIYQTHVWRVMRCAVHELVSRASPADKTPDQLAVNARFRFCRRGALACAYKVTCATY